MAVTIRQAPQTMIPGFNDIIYVVSSDKTTEENFQYVADIYIDNDEGNVTHAGRNYLREKIPADPIYSSGVVNISHKIRQFLGYDIGNDLYASQKCPNSIIDIEIKFGEEFGGSSGTTVYANQATSTKIRTFNGVLDHPNRNAYNKSTFVGSTASTTRRFLTNQPDNVKMRTTEDGWVYAIVESVNDLASITIKTTDSLAAVTSHTITNDFAGALSTVGRYMIRFPAGPNNIMIAKSDWTIFDDIVSYTIEGTAGAGQTREALSYVIDTSCTEHTLFRFHFLNQLGGFDSFTFTQAHQHTTNIEKNTFKRNLTTRIGGGRYGYNNKDFSEVTYRTKLKDSIKVVSGWISELESTWLEELIASPVIFHDDATHGLLAVKVMDMQYIRRQDVTDGLSNIEMTFQYSYDRYTQDQ